MAYAVLIPYKGYTEFRARDDEVEIVGSEPRDIEATKQVILRMFPRCEFEVIQP